MKHRRGIKSQNPALDLANKFRIRGTVGAMSECDFDHGAQSDHGVEWIFAIVAVAEAVRNLRREIPMQ